MTRFEPDTLTLAGELDRIADEYDRTEAELREMDDDENARAASKLQYLGELEQMGQAVGELINEYDAEATVTVRGLNAGEYAKVKNRTNEAASRMGTDAGAPGSGELVFVAAGLVDAPGYDGDGEDFDAKLEWVAGQPIGKRKWLQDLVDERTVVGEKNWRQLAGRSSVETPAR